ncbi:MAG: xanthine phosphoribosyltransferase [Rhodobacteraceae bacterium]|nr:xanthine phosphoribosyltransferase [Paracoccaceae bacterium]MCY4196720.1 xanthine phosphoribosyltransferase [Paracoccaceae bacterium]
MNQQSQDKSFIVSWDQLHRDGRALAWRLEAMVQSGRNWSRLMAVTRGGMAPAMIVARELDIRVVDSVSVRSYDHQTQMEPQVIKEPFLEDSEDMLVIDDLVDTGRTLDLVRRLFPAAHFATIYAKPKGRPFVDTFITEVSQDTWIYFPWDTALQYIGPVRSET